MVLMLYLLQVYEVMVQRCINVDVYLVLFITVLYYAVMFMSWSSLVLVSLTLDLVHLDFDSTPPWSSLGHLWWTAGLSPSLVNERCGYNLSPYYRTSLVGLWRPLNPTVKAIESHCESHWIPLLTLWFIFNLISNVNFICTTKSCDFPLVCHCNFFSYSIYCILYGALLVLLYCIWMVYVLGGLTSLGLGGSIE